MERESTIKQQFDQTKAVTAVPTLVNPYVAPAWLLFTPLKDKKIDALGILLRGMKADALVGTVTLYSVTVQMVEKGASPRNFFSYV